MSPVPVEEKLFAAGDGDVIEDAPIGYYRFHYWKTDETPKGHDNYLAITKEAGPICVSVIRGTSAQQGEESGAGGYYRLLIRTIFVQRGKVACVSIDLSLFIQLLGVQVHDTDG